MDLQSLDLKSHPFSRLASWYDQLLQQLLPLASLEVCLPFISISVVSYMHHIQYMYLQYYPPSANSWIILQSFIF